jgi:hypothetical protein
VVTKCCEVKTVEAKEAKKEHKEEGAAVATKGSAAVSGSGQAAVTKQTITQTNTQSVGDVTSPDDATVGNSVTFLDQTNDALNVNVPVNVQIAGLTLNPAVAWNGGQANTGSGDVTSTELVVPLMPGG